MAIVAFTATKNYADDATFTQAKLDAFVDALDTWLNTEVETKCADKTGTETVSGDWTLSGSITFSGNLILTTAISAAGNYTMLAADHVILKSGISGGGDTLNLISAATLGAGRMLFIKDSSGTATTNNITVDPAGSETIDGAGTYAMDTNYEGISLVSDGTNWSVTSLF